jgi:23S rRNA pseudouridine1911/1915/1917 synthase
MAATSKNADSSHIAQSRRLDALVRERSGGSLPWNQARNMVQTGKVLVDGALETNPARLVVAGQTVEIVPNAPRPATRNRLAADAIAYVDDQIVVVRKPAGLSSVPFEPGERGTLHELVRAWLNRTAAQRHDRATGDLGIVHRLDRETSGLLIFTRTLLAKRHLAQQMRIHSVERRYLAIAEGVIAAPRTFCSNLVRDRGDGLRGSTSNPKLGQRAVTHVAPVERFELFTLVSCELQTGRTHQIRIHLSEAGHPVVGERVYIRGYPGELLKAPRLMLHAAILGFDHPRRHERLRFEEPIPADMQQLLAQARAHRGR